MVGGGGCVYFVLVGFVVGLDVVGVGCFGVFDDDGLICGFGVWC